MKIQIQFNYTESRVPPRCRIARDFVEVGTIKLTVREVTAEQAPVAIREDFYSLKTSGREVREYRWFGGKLWKLDMLNRHVGDTDKQQTAEQFASDPYPKSLKAPTGWEYGRHLSKQQRRVDLMSWARSLLFIDGVRWCLAGEPRYVVMTFGLGGNHGIGWGTSLSTDNSYNSNIGRGSYFRCDQFEAAVAHATQVATGRGDTKALPIVEAQSPTLFEVLIPEAVRLRPAAEHGDGDPFMNGLELMISGVRNPAVAGALVAVSAAKLLMNKGIDA